MSPLGIDMGITGVSARAHAPIKLGLKLEFRRRVLEETASHKIIADDLGTTCIIRKDGRSTIPKYLQFPVRDRKSWNFSRRILKPHRPGRLPADWEALKRRWENRDYPLWTYCRPGAHSTDSRQCVSSTLHIRSSSSSGSG